MEITKKSRLRLLFCGIGVVVKSVYFTFDEEIARRILKICGSDGRFNARIHFPPRKLECFVDDQGDLEGKVKEILYDCYSVYNKDGKEVLQTRGIRCPPSGFPTAVFVSEKQRLSFDEYTKIDSPEKIDCDVTSIYRALIR